MLACLAVLAVILAAVVFRVSLAVRRLVPPGELERTIGATSESGTRERMRKGWRYGADLARRQVTDKKKERP